MSTFTHLFYLSFEMKCSMRMESERRILFTLSQPMIDELSIFSLHDCKRLSANKNNHSFLCKQVI